MKQLIYIPLLLLLHSTSFCQSRVTAIQTDKNKVLYEGVDNPLTLAVESFVSYNTFLTTDNGVMPPNRDGHYNIRPAHTGMANLNVKVKNSQGIHDMVTYRFVVKPLPDPLVLLNGQTKGEIRVETARKLTGPVANFADFGLDAKCTIDRFMLLVIRDQKVVLMKTLRNPEGASFSDDLEVLDMIQTLKGNEKLIISEISCITPDGIKHHLQPVEFKITNAD